MISCRFLTEPSEIGTQLNNYFINKIDILKNNMHISNYKSIPIIINRWMREKVVDLIYKKSVWRKSNVL